MRKIFLLIFLIFALKAFVFPQQVKDWELTAKVHQVNYYDIYYPSNPDSVKPEEKSLSGTVVFDRRGNLRVRFEYFRPDGIECTYRKTVNFYDRNNRKIRSELYQSDKSKAFCLNNAPLLKETELKNNDGKTPFTEETIYKYDQKGRDLQQTTFNNQRIKVQENKYQYNRRGERTRYTITQVPNRIDGPFKTLDFHSLYRKNGKIRINYSYHDGKPVRKTIDYLDGEKRIVREEQYKLEADSHNRIIKVTLDNVSRTFYRGKREIMDWKLYYNSGRLQTQLYILSENDNELMRLEYARKNSTQTLNRTNSDQTTHYRFDYATPSETTRRLKYLLKYDQCVESPDWVPADFEARFYKFDAYGNILQIRTLQRRTTGDKRESINERNLTYYK